MAVYYLEKTAFKNRKKYNMNHADHFVKENFFKGLKVIELANVLAGPAVGLFFSELGAEVIKVENKLTNGDVTRSWKLAKENPDSKTSAYFASVNLNKQSLFVDFNLPDDKNKVYEMIKSADIVIVNYKPGDEFKLGMDHETIRKINPSIIYAQVTGFGTDVKRTAYDLVLQAETGFMFMNGNKESGPIKMPVALIDILAAHQLKEGVLIALLKKMKSGKGSKVTVSLYDAAIASLANQASNWLMTGENPQPIGSLHPNIAPYGEIFRTSDNKQIVLAIGNNKQFAHLCELLGCPELITDERFRNNPQRVKHRTKLYELLNDLFCQKSSGPVMESLKSKDVPAGIIKSLEDVFEDTASTKLIRKQMTNDMELKNVQTAVFTISD